MTAFLGGATAFGLIFLGWLIREVCRDAGLSPVLAPRPHLDRLHGLRPRV